MKRIVVVAALVLALISVSQAHADPRENAQKLAKAVSGPQMNTEGVIMCESSCTFNAFVPEDDYRMPQNYIVSADAAQLTIVRTIEGTRCRHVSIDRGIDGIRDETSSEGCMRGVIDQLVGERYSQVLEFLSRELERRRTR